AVADDLGQRGRRDRLVAAADDDVHVVRADVARAERLDARERRAAAERRAADGERGHGDELAARVAHGDHAQAPAVGEVVPPGEQPFRGDEQTAGVAVFDQRLPLRAQALQGVRGIDDAHGQSGHAALRVRARETRPSYRAWVSPTMRSMEKRSRTMLRARPPMAAASAGSSSRRSTPRASASPSEGGTSSPVAPSSTTSGASPTVVATTGAPDASDSRRALDSASDRDGMTATCTCARSPG